MKTQQPHPTPTFTTSLWFELVAALADAFRLTPAEEEKLRASKTGRFIAALPFLAGCQQAKRTSLAHTAVYVLAAKGPSRAIFDHSPTDDGEVLDRLASISTFQGGDRAIVNRGMNLLALQMICGYARDQAKDTVTGDYNPLLHGTWDAPSMMEKLITQIVDTKCPEMDALFSIEDAQWSWWD